MDVGIVTHYTRTPRAYAALQLAELLAPRARVHLISTATQPARLHPRWDRAVLPLARLNLSRWLLAFRPKLMIWTEPVAIHVARYMGRLADMPIRTVLVAGMLQRVTAHVACPAFQVLLAPSKQSREFLVCECDLKRTVACPWAPLAVPLARDIDGNGPVRIYLPLGGELGRELAMPWVEVAATLSCRPEGRGIEVTVSHAGWSPRAARFLERIARCSRGRLRAVPAGTYHDELLRLAAADLTLLPAPADPLGMDILLSRSMGAPVVVVDTPLARELVREGGSGLLVPAGPDGRADPALLLQETLSAVAPGAMLGHMQSQVGHGLDSRRAEFEAIWLGLLDEVS